MSDNIIDIMRDIAAGRKNSLGDYWSISYCNEAAERIAELEKQVEGLNRAVEHAGYMAADAEQFTKFMSNIDLDESLTDDNRDSYMDLISGLDCGIYEFRKRIPSPPKD